VTLILGLGSLTGLPGLVMDLVDEVRAEQVLEHVHEGDGVVEC
jgi:hypothetical protein